MKEPRLSPPRMAKCDRCGRQTDALMSLSGWGGVCRACLPPPFPFAPTPKAGVPKPLEVVAICDACGIVGRLHEGRPPFATWQWVCAGGCPNPERLAPHPRPASVSAAGSCIAIPR